MTTFNPDNPKYALVKLHRLAELKGDELHNANLLLNTLEFLGVLDRGKEPGSEFFVMRLRDKYADDALYRYSLAAAQDGEGDYARAIEELASRAGAANPHCKKPD